MYKGVSSARKRNVSPAGVADIKLSLAFWLLKSLVPIPSSSPRSDMQPLLIKDQNNVAGRSR
jgi:hypothetical protein